MDIANTTVGKHEGKVRNTPSKGSFCLEGLSLALRTNSFLINSTRELIKQKKSCFVLQSSPGETVFYNGCFKHRTIFAFEFDL